MRTATLPIHTCTRCGHEWVGRKKGKPKVCSKCSSPYWDRKRTRPATVQAIVRKKNGGGIKCAEKH